MTDQATTFWDVLGAVGNVATGIAAVWATLLAKRGLNSWRDQMRGSSQYDVARRCLMSALQIREGISAFRGPGISPGEMHDALKKAGLEPEKLSWDESTKKGDELVYIERWRGISEPWTRLRADLLEAEVVLGPEWRRVHEPLESTLRKLRFAWIRYSRAKRDGRLHKDWEEIDALMYDESDTDKLDPFASDVEAAVRDFADAARPYLGHRPAKIPPKEVSSDLKSTRELRDKK